LWRDSWVGAALVRVRVNSTVVRLGLTALLAAQLAACSAQGREADAEKEALSRAEAETEATSRAAYDDLRAGNYPALEARFVPEMRTPKTRDALTEMHAAIPAGAPVRVEQTGGEANVHFEGANSRRFVLERRDYVYPDAVVHVATTLSVPIKDTLGDAPFILAFITHKARYVPLPGSRYSVENIDLSVTPSPGK
jgi:hypothetical protein